MSDDLKPWPNPCAIHRTGCRCGVSRPRSAAWVLVATLVAIWAIVSATLVALILVAFA